MFSMSNRQAESNNSSPHWTRISTPLSAPRSLVFVAKSLISWMTMRFRTRSPLLLEETLKDLCHLDGRGGPELTDPVGNGP